MQLVRNIVALLALSGLFCAVDAASAAPADDCKLCRESHQACAKNHSREACKTEYDICIKHCRRR